MSTSFETRRIKEALELQIGAIQAYAARLSGHDMEKLESDLIELRQAVADLQGIVESLPHKHAGHEPAGGLPASPATTRPEREAKGSAVADGTQRPKEE